MSGRPVKVLFASGSDAVAAQTLERFKHIFPELPLVVVSEFPSPEGEWIPYHIRRPFRDNLALAQSRLAGRTIRIAAMILEPRTPHLRMRLLALRLAPWRMLAFNETGQHFRLRPDNLPVILRNLLWRGGNLIRSFSKQLRRLDRASFTAGVLYWIARAGPWPFGPRPPKAWPTRERAPGISVVIPSRNGRELLAACLPRIEGASEIIVIDNGSDDGTAEFLASAFPHVVVEVSGRPMAFAAAVNQGSRSACHSHICLLNNDMQVDPGFLDALRSAFDKVPDLFCSSAQIFFPEGQRREETGVTVWAPHVIRESLPVRCEEPIEGEDGSYVLYGSGGCTLYDAAKLAQLGGFDPIYEAAYVEDLDLGVRAWQRGWPSVYCAGARVLHQHRATTTRYFTAEQLDFILERNFIRFLARFKELWKENLLRLRNEKKLPALRAAAVTAAPAEGGPDAFLALVSGGVSVLPGKPRTGRPLILVASPYIPYPLSHGAAVRIYELMRRAAADFDQVLVSFVSEPASVPPQLRDICVEVVTVRRPGSHALPSTHRPDTVEEFDSPAFHAALQQTTAKWKPQLAQLEFTQMAQYVPDCGSAPTILVEHDITFDLYSQMLAQAEDWETRRQFERWRNFESEAWGQVSRVVTMSDKDRQAILGSVAIPNGADLERFQPATEPPEARRLLFIGSFAHRPNILALEFFLRDVFPLLPGVALHVIAGQNHQRFWDLRHPGVEVEGYVADVRPAYRRATLVIAPLVASAGTNIKILEAMAMGKAIVSTEAGVNGLDLEKGTAVIANTAAEIAAAVTRLLDSPPERIALEAQARRTAEERFGWDAIAREQKRLYDSLLQE